MKIDFKVKRAEDCAIIDTKKWVADISTGITIHRLSGRDIPTGIAHVISTYPVKKGLKNLVQDGDLVLVSKVASDISQYRKFAVDRDDNRYFHLPLMQILGIFEGGIVSYDSLQMLTDKILIKKLEPKYEGLLRANDGTMFGEVVKVGTNRFNKKWEKEPLTVKVGDKIIVRDNISTEIMLDGNYYFAVEEPMVVGIFENYENLTLENLTLINNNILMQPYIPETIDNSSIMTPFLNYEELDYTEIYNRDLFKVLKTDKRLDKIDKNDILLVDRNLTNYACLSSEKYFIISGLDFISAKVN